MNIIKLIVAFFLSITQLFSPYVMFAVKGLDSYFEDWSADQTYTEEYAVELEKDPDKDFVILNFSDIQLEPKTIYSEEGDYTYALLRHEIEEIQPDLITLSGDNSSSETGYVKLAKFFDSFGIPWAPIMGNHDGENGNTLIEASVSYILANSEYCLFKFGPEGMGYGNYVINITENGKIIHSLVMMDTHSDAADTDEGIVNYAADGSNSDDNLWASQIEWYKWCINGVEKLAGNEVESTVIFHIPCYDYRVAAEEIMEYNYDENGNAIVSSDGRTYRYVKSMYKDTCFGSLGESICAPLGDNGFFDAVLELGSTKNIICGHDHTNSCSMLYKGVRLNYAMKSGHGSYYSDLADKNGSSIVTIGSDGHATFSQHCYQVTGDIPSTPLGVTDGC